MKIWILSCNTGGGHNAAARAVRNTAEERGHEVKIVDYLNYFNERVNRNICDSYIGVARYVPGFFGAFYHLGQFVSNAMPSKARSVVYYWSGIAAKKLWDEMQNDIPDCVISTHFLASEAIVWLKAHGYPVPLSLSISTDYTCVPFWDEGSCDYNIIPHEELTEEFVERGVKPETILPFGIPVEKRFMDLPTQQEARVALDLPQEPKVHLIMGGSMGAAYMKRLTKKLYAKRPHAYFVVVCGNNDKIWNYFDRKYQDKHNVRVLRFTNEVPLYMAACDAIYSKPGGLTSTEALVACAPLIHTKPIPGCESRNFKFFGKRWLSVPAKHVGGQVKAGIYLSEHPEERQRMIHCQEKYQKKDTATNIILLLESKISESLDDIKE